MSRAEGEEYDEVEGMSDMELEGLPPLPGELESQDSEEDVFDANDDCTIIKRLAFTTKECQTPGRYAPRQRVGQPVQVFLRLRPLFAEEKGTLAHDCIKILNDTTVEMIAPPDSAASKYGEKVSKYSFSRVFNAQADQDEVYRASAKPLVDSMFQGQNGLLFAYGITNSGKTYTIQGTKQNPGLLSGILKDVFSKMEDNRKYRLPVFRILVSYIEIYNEKIYDLLATNEKFAKKAPCKLRNTKDDQVFVVGVKEMSVETQEEALAILREGQQNRQVCQTLLNSDSSRSHSVFSIKFISEHEEGIYSKFSIVDLAGAERNKRTETSGRKLKEAARINNSLMCLGRCLETLRYNQQQSSKAKWKIVPFRDSKITQLFRDSLCGWGRTVMIANANPSVNDFDETNHAIKYASVAREIRCESRIDTRRVPASASKKLAFSSSPLEDLQAGSNDEGNEELEDEIDRLLDEQFELKEQLVEAEERIASTELRVRADVCREMEEQIEASDALWEKRMEEAKRSIGTKFERKFMLLKRQMEDTLSEEQSVELESIENVQKDLQRIAVENIRTQCKREVEELRAQVRELEREKERMIEEQQEREAQYKEEEEQKSVALLSTLQSLQEKMIEVDDRSEEQKGEAERRLEKVDESYQKDIQKLQKSNASYKASNTKQKKKIAELEDELQQNQLKFKEDKQKTADLMKSISSRNDKISKMNKMLGESNVEEQSLAERDAKLKQYEEIIKKRLDEVKKLQRSKEAKKATISKLKVHLYDLNAKMKDLAAKGAKEAAKLKGENERLVQLIQDMTDGQQTPVEKPVEKPRASKKTKASTQSKAPAKKAKTKREVLARNVKKAEAEAAEAEANKKEENEQDDLGLDDPYVFEKENVPKPTPKKASTKKKRTTKSKLKPSSESPLKPLTNRIKSNLFKKAMEESPAPKQEIIYEEVERIMEKVNEGEENQHKRAGKENEDQVDDDEYLPPKKKTKTKKTAAKKTKGRARKKRKPSLDDTYVEEEEEEEEEVRQPSPVKTRRTRRGRKAVNYAE